MRTRFCEGQAQKLSNRDDETKTARPKWRDQHDEIKKAKARERSRNLRIRTPRGETNNARVKLQDRDGESKKTKPTLQRPGCRNPDAMFSENLIRAMKFWLSTTAANQKTQKNRNSLKHQHLN